MTRPNPSGGGVWRRKVEAGDWVRVIQHVNPHDDVTPLVGAVCKVMNVYSSDSPTVETRDGHATVNLLPSEWEPCAAPGRDDRSSLMQRVMRALDAWAGSDSFRRATLRDEVANLVDAEVERATAALVRERDEAREEAKSHRESWRVAGDIHERTFKRAEAAESEVAGLKAEVERLECERAALRCAAYGLLTHLRAGYSVTLHTECADRLRDALKSADGAQPPSGPRREVGAVVRYGVELFAVIKTGEGKCQRELGQDSDFDAWVHTEAGDVFVRWMSEAECARHGIPYVERGAKPTATDKPGPSLDELRHEFREAWEGSKNSHYGSDAHAHAALRFWNATHALSTALSGKEVGRA